MYDSGDLFGEEVMAGLAVGLEICVTDYYFIGQPLPNLPFAEAFYKCTFKFLLIFEYSLTRPLLKVTVLNP